MLVYPIAWVVYSLVRGAIVDWYPYPFLDVETLGYAEVLLTCAVLAVAMVALSGCSPGSPASARRTPQLPRDRAKTLQGKGKGAATGVRALGSSIDGQFRRWRATSLPMASNGAI